MSWSGPFGLEWLTGGITRPGRSGSNLGPNAGLGNIGGLLSDSGHDARIRILNNPDAWPHVAAMMKKIARYLAVLIALGVAQPAAAACYADYKAKQDQPLRLHYGVIELPDAACADRARTNTEVARRIAQGGWQLLNIVSVFGAEGLAERQSSAGAYFLRY